jgi:hypothetical protein
MKTAMTTDPINVSPNPSTSPVRGEWGRWRDLERLFGIKRGTAYNLMAEGKIKGVVLRRKGNLHGCRLFHLESVRQYLNSLLETQ